MAFSIQEFRSSLSEYEGIHRPSHFYVRIFPPSFLQTLGYVRDIEFLCDTTNLPGIQFNAVDIQPLGYGNSEKRPVDAVFESVRCDFFVDNTNSFFDFFYKWVGNINNFGVDTTRSSNATRINYGEFAYPKEYEGTVEIYLFKPDGTQTLKLTLNQAFPLAIGDLGLAWEINDSISKIPVSFSYNTWSQELLPFNRESRAVGQKYASLRNNLVSYTPTNPGGGRGNAGDPPALMPLSDPLGNIPEAGTTER